MAIETSSFTIYCIVILAFTYPATSKGAVYKNASHFWPLNYVTGIKDVVTLAEASIYGMDGVSLKGSGTGYMELQLGASAIRLGEFSGPCLTKLRQCQSGFTMSFWIRFLDLKRRNEGDEIEIVTFKSSSNSNIIKIALLGSKGQHLLVYTLNDGEFQHEARIILSSTNWIHSTMVSSASGDFQVFTTGKKVADSVKRKFQSNNGNSAAIMIGSLLRLGNFKGPKVLLDEIAIWYSQLSSMQIRQTVTKQGEIIAQKTCQGNRTSLTVTWQRAIDPYKQIISYDVIGRSPNGLFMVSKPPNSTVAKLDKLSPDTLYRFKVIARTLNGLTINSSVINCSTNQTKSSNKLQTGLQLVALSSHKIRILLRGSSQKTQNTFYVSYKSSGQPSVDKMVFSSGFLNYTVANLTEDTEYEVTVAVYSSRGVERYKKSIRTKKIIKLPKNPVRSLTVVDISWNKARLQWLPPMDYDEPALEYQVICNGREVTRTVVPSATLSGLNSNTKYTIHVKAGAMGLGYQSRSTIITFKTIERFPTPIVINVTNIGWNSAVVEWRSVSRRAEIFYRISYHSERDKRKRAFVVSFQRNEPVYRQRLFGLEQLTGYFVTVQSGNGTVFGKHQKTYTYFKTNDRDECLDSSHNCQNTSECFNTRGSFVCNCLAGYFSKDGRCLALSKLGPVCKTSLDRGITWKETSHGQLAIGQCPMGTEGVARRYCKRLNEREASWLSPDLSGCVSLWLYEFSDKMNSKDVNSSALMQTLADLYKGRVNSVGGDIQVVVNMLDAIIGMSKSSSRRELASTAKNLVDITDDLLSSRSSETWKDLPRTQQIKSAASVMNTVEYMASAYSSSASTQSIKNDPLKISKPNTVLQVSDVLDTSALYFDAAKFEGTIPGSRIVIPMHSVEQEHKGSMSVYFGAFRNIENLLGAKLGDSDKKDNVSWETGSNVVAASLFPIKARTFKEPIVITHRIPEINSSVMLTCVFWKFSKNGSGSWSSEGCKLDSHNETHATCHCFHLTNFNVLMSVTKAPIEIDAYHERKIYWITLACICISLLALVLAFITFCAVKALKSSRNTTHKHLVVALFFAQLIFLVGIDKTANIIVCRVIAVMLHYLFLVAFTLMGLEGFVLYMMLVRVHASGGRLDHRKMLAACWAIPVIIVSITLAVDYKAYGNDQYCWLSYERGFIWSFVGPVLLIILVNIVFLIIAIRVMAVKSKKREMLSQEIWYWIKCCSMLVTILGLCWIIGIFYINQESIVVAYIFSILNALQGLAIFIFLCLLDPRVKDAYAKYFCCKKRDKASITSRTLSATKSTMPTSRFREVDNNSVKSRKNAEEIKVLRGSNAGSTEYQEIVVAFSEDDLSCPV